VHLRNWRALRLLGMKLQLNSIIRIHAFERAPFLLDAGKLEAGL
jgi:hypothetical protein